MPAVPGQVADRRHADDQEQNSMDHEADEVSGEVPLLQQRPPLPSVGPSQAGAAVLCNGHSKAENVNMTVNNSTAQQQSVVTGDRDRFKEHLRRRLVECGWRDQLRMLCRDAIKENESNITLEMLISTVTPRARELVPDSLKKELLQELKADLFTQNDL